MSHESALRRAAYARYSSDLQSPLSIDDQLRICREYAKSRGFVFLEEHVYVDEALSGVGADRPGLGRLLNAALSSARPFDIILLDDSSRLARNTKDALTFFERLNFAGIRLIAVSQGIDSDNEQAHAEARKELLKHVSEIRMFPQNGGNGNRKSHYVAEGNWHLIGNEEDHTNAIQAQVRSVADPRNQSFQSLTRIGLLRQTPINSQ